MKYAFGLFISFLSCIPLGAQPAMPPEIMGEIARIENGLLAGIQVEGRLPETYRLTERMAHYKVPGLSLAVVMNGELRWAKGYGLANTQTGAAVTPETLFQAGSISKPVAALAVLKLWEEGKVDLDTDVNEYLRDWRVPENRFTADEKVTLRRLLTHTAGMSVHGFPGYTQADDFPDDITVLNGQGNTAPIVVDTFPGSLWRYSGGGYTVMERVVENVTGQEFQDYLDEHVLPSLGMTTSTYAQPLPPARHAAASAAYDSKGELIEGLWHNYPEQAAAGLWTTPSDLARYCIAVQQMLAGREGLLLQPATVKAMLTKHENDWGLGPSLSGEGDSLTFGHGGKNAGFTNNMLAFAHRGAAIIVMTSGDNGWDLLSEIMRSASRYYDWGIMEPRTVRPVDLPLGALEKWTGRYQYEEQVPGIGDYVVTVNIKDGRLEVYDAPEETNHVLTPLGDEKFIDLESGDELQFTSGENGRRGFTWNGAYRFFAL